VGADTGRWCRSGEDTLLMLLWLPLLSTLLYCGDVDDEEEGGGGGGGGATTVESFERLARASKKCCSDMWRLPARSPSLTKEELEDRPLHPPKPLLPPPSNDDDRGESGEGLLNAPSLRAANIPLMVTPLNRASSVVMVRAGLVSNPRRPN